MLDDTRRTTLHRFVVCAVFLTACSSSPPPSPEAPSSTAVASAAPSADPAPADIPAPSASATASAPPAEVKIDPPKKPKTKWVVGGKSLSEITADDLVAALKKAGLNKDGNSGGSKGNGYETINITVVKGKLKGMFYLARPASEPTFKTSSMTPSATANYNKGNAKLADTFDQDADVYVDVELEDGGDAKAAKKILDSIVKKGK